MLDFNLFVVVNRINIMTCLFCDYHDPLPEKKYELNKYIRILIK